MAHTPKFVTGDLNSVVGPSDEYTVSESMMSSRLTSKAVSQLLVDARVTEEVPSAICEPLSPFIKGHPTFHPTHPSFGIFTMNIGVESIEGLNVGRSTIRIAAHGQVTQLWSYGSLE